MNKFNINDRVKYVGLDKRYHGLEAIVLGFRWADYARYPPGVGEGRRVYYPEYGYELFFIAKNVAVGFFAESTLIPILPQQNHIPEEVRAIFRESVKA